MSSIMSPLPGMNDAGVVAEAAFPEPCLVVGIGASAGGQGALEQLFTSFPPDCGLSFVVIMHIPPDGPSFLAEMLNRYTTMAVVTAEEGMPLQSNRVHVIPAGWEMVVRDGRLRLEEPGTPRGAHHPIDRFFRMLAADARERAIAVVLSGSGTDGADGVRAVKEAGGIVIVQEPASAMNPAMPRGAIATGVADFVLPAEEIPAKLAGIACGTCALPPRTCQLTTLNEDLAGIFGIVKAHTGHDFGSYKINTVMRRIERRMAVNDIAGIRKYAALLESDPQEAHALAQDIMIGVTSFFRDTEAFETIRKEIIPRLLANRDSADPVRIWHACCATGEEVYSMAFLIREYLDEQRMNAAVQFFATDIDEAAIGQARAGIYPDGIEAEVGEERLTRFFTRVDGRWQVAKQLREMVVFAHHSLIKNPPFSRLDLLVCRNFLIYLNPDMQKRLISLFHQVLKPGGVLFLGSSETVGRHSDLFTPIDKKWKIFQRLENGRRGDTIFPFTPVRYFPGTGRLLRPDEASEPTPGAAAEKQLMERYSPPCVVVNEKYEVVHVSTRTSRFLEVPVGDPTRDLLRMAREELRPALRAAVYKCFAEKREVVFRGVRVNTVGEETTVNVRVEPLNASPSAGQLAMVTFEPGPLAALPVPAGDEEPATGDEISKEILIRQLEEQLRVTTEQLQTVTEQLETSNAGFMSANEELISMNEEFQSANEELQSTNEELETSKEELQALNEELSTVNAELQGKVEELNQANGDMENLLASSEIAVIFLDRRLTIKRFSPAAARIFNLIASDAGRPFRHLAGTIDWSGLPDDAAKVLEKLDPIEREVAAIEGGRHFLMRVLPYRSGEGRIDGTVVALIDITERKRMEDALRQAKEEWERTFDSVPDLIAIMDDRHRIIRANRAMAERLGLTPEECVGRHCFHCVHGADGPADSCPHALTLADGREHAAELYEERLGRDFLVTTTPLTDERGRMIGSVHVARDITERKRAEEERARLAAIVESSDDAIIAKDLDGTIRTWNAGAERMFGYRPDEAVGQPITLLVPSGLQPEEEQILQRLTAGERIDHFETVRVARDGRQIDVSVTVSPIRDGAGQIIGASKIVRDITERKRAEEALRESEERTRRKLDSILTPEGDMGELELADIIDVPALQSLMEDLYRLSKTPVGIIDLQGKVLVGVGWQEICTRFHRAHPETCKNCVESDLHLSAGILPGEYRLYRCKNNLWDAATPIIVGDRHFGNLFLGQFFFEDEEPDYEFFRSQARQYGFDEEEYMAALGKVPRLSRESLSVAMAYFMKFAAILSRLSYSNLKLARSLAERDTLMDAQRMSSARLDLLADTASELLRTSSPQAVVDSLCKKVMAFLDCHAFFNFLVDEEEGCLRLNACAGIPEDEAQRIEWLDYGVAVCGCAARDACRIVAEEIPTTPDPRTELVRSYGIQAYACHPLMVQGRVLGTLSFGTRTKAHFTDDELALMNAVADQVAIAMERKRTEEVLRRAHDELEIRVAERTEELASAVNVLQGEIADREQAEERLLRLNRLYTVLSKTREAIVRASTRDSLFREVGRIAVNHGGFRLAWVGLVEGESGMVKTVAAHGDTDYLDDIRITVQEDAHGCGPTGISIREGTFCICNDFQNDPCTRPWHERGRAHGIGASASIALRQNGRVVGALTLYAGEKDFFDWQQVELLQQMGEDVSFALDNLEREALLRESERKFRTLFEESKDVIFIMNTAGKLLDINPAGIELFGHTREGFFSLDFTHDFYSDPLERERFRQALFAQGFVRDYEVGMKKKNGEVLCMLMTASVIHNEQGEITGYRGILHDVTERKRLEQQLLQAQKMESIGLLAGGVAHDFNNLLTAISGYSQIIQEQFASQDEMLAMCIDQVLGATGRAVELTGNLLAFSRKQIINPQPVRINDIIENLSKLLTRIIGEDIEFGTTLARRNLTVLADRGQIDQVLINLATNARDAMPNGGQLLIRTERAVVAGEAARRLDLDEGAYCLIFVSDSGEGMDRETQQRIFEPFFTTKETGKGTGLGLSIIYGIVRQHNGTISVASEPGKGATFTIYLPLVEEVADAAPEEAPSAPPLGTETLLLAEDDAMVRKYMRQILEMAGYTVIPAENGAEAVQLYTEHRDRVALVVCDVVMPKKNGKEVYDEIRAMDPQARFLFTSGYNDEIIHKKGILLDDIEFLMKPVSRLVLLEKLRAMLDA